MDTVHNQAPAKINLGLFIKGKRPDGYHLLETILFPYPSLYDELIITPSSKPGCHLEIEGIHIEGNPQENLVTRAYSLLKATNSNLPGVNVKLIKRIPAGAGLGGGSSDAASMLKACNQLFKLNYNPTSLSTLAARLGADVPFFIFYTPMLASGIGTELAEITFNDFPFSIKLITPSIHSSTIAAYKALKYKEFDHKRNLRETINLPFEKWKSHLVNDLEKPVFEMYPSLAEIKASLYDEGAVYAAMSGSGSAVFGLFNKD